MCVEGEIVGGGGRIGSAISRFAGCKLFLVPRDGPIGASSPERTPIYVCTGADSIADVLERTASSRLQDLVVMQNGVHRQAVEEAVRTRAASDCGPVDVTLAVLYFSVLERGGPAQNGGCSFVHGRWAGRFARLLRDNGLDCEEVPSPSELDARAAEKLMWSSCMWLMCHEKSTPVTVSEVHADAERQATLKDLVAELLPVAKSQTLPGGSKGRAGAEPHALDSVEGVVNRIAQYSNRISGAIPSRKLALEELHLRNAWFLSGGREAQELHVKLLQKQGVEYSTAEGGLIVRKS